MHVWLLSCGTSSLTYRTAHALQVFENKFGTMSEETASALDTLTVAGSDKSRRNRAVSGGNISKVSRN